LALLIAHTDANDFLYYVNASRHYHPEPNLSASPCPFCGSTPLMIWKDDLMKFLRKAEKK